MESKIIAKDFELKLIHLLATINICEDLAVELVQERASFNDTSIRKRIKNAQLNTQVAVDRLQSQFDVKSGDKINGMLLGLRPLIEGFLSSDLETRKEALKVIENHLNFKLNATTNK